MNFLISLAWKNLFRYFKRTIITASALAFGISLYIFMASWLKGVEIDSERNLVWYETSSARIMHKDYWQNREKLSLEHTVKNPEVIIREMEENFENADFASRTSFEGELIIYKDPFPEDGSVNLKITAIDPVKDIKVFKLNENIEQGRFIKPGKEEILIGSWLAEDIGAKPGYSVRISTRTKYKQRQLMDLTVAGIINCPNPLINRSGIFIPIDIADLYLEMENAVTEINVKLPGDIHNSDKFNEIKTALDKYKDLEILQWQTLGEDAIAMAEGKRASSSIILILLFIIASVGISNTMLMAVFERTKEIGMMRSMGMNSSQILWNFSLEAAFIAIIGSAFGLGLGLILAYWIINYGIDYTSILREMDAGYRVSGVLKGAWNFKAMATACISGVVVSIASAILPAKRALKMEISECLRNK